MPAIRLPQSAEALLPFCRRAEEPADNACFDTYADMLTFAASCGFHRINARKPEEPDKFLANIYPIDLAVFKNQGLFPNLSPGGSKPATYGRFKTSHSEARTSYHLFDLVQG